MDATKTNPEVIEYSADYDQEDTLLCKLQELPFVAIALAVIAYDMVRNTVEKLPTGASQNLTTLYAGSVFGITALPEWKCAIFGLGALPFSASIGIAGFLTAIESFDPEGDYGFQTDAREWRSLSILFFPPTAILATLTWLR